MAHFAEIDTDGLVLRVIVVKNDELLEDGVEVEAKGIEFCHLLFGGTWLQTSYHNKIRKNFAGVGFKYDSELDAFIPIKPFASWVLNRETCRWEAPTPKPNDGNFYIWDETTCSWVLDLINNLPQN